MSYIPDDWDDEDFPHDTDQGNLDDIEWTEEDLDENIYDFAESDLPDLEAFSLYSDPSITQVLDENLDEQEFHREEIKHAYKEGDDFATTVLLSTFFESYLSTKLTNFAENNETIIEPDEIRNGELGFNSMIDKSYKLGFIESEEERNIMRAVAVSRNQYLYDTFEHLEPENETLLEGRNLLDSAIDLYDSRLGIPSEERITNLERKEKKKSGEAIDRIEKTIKEGSKPVSTMLMDSIFQKYMVQQLNKPGNGAWYCNGSKTKARDDTFSDIITRFKNIRYSQDNRQTFGKTEREFDRMKQVFNAIHSAKTSYSHEIEAFAEGNGISESDYQKAVEYFEEIKEEVAPDSGTYAPSSQKGDKWGSDLN